MTWRYLIVIIYYICYLRIKNTKSYLELFISILISVLAVVTYIKTANNQQQVVELIIIFLLLTILLSIFAIAGAKTIIRIQRRINYDQQKH